VSRYERPTGTSTRGESIFTREPRAPPKNVDVPSVTNQHSHLILLASLINLRLRYLPPMYLHR
jgi:hypothetical protein